MSYNGVKGRIVHVFQGLIDQGFDVTKRVDDRYASGKSEFVIKFDEAVHTLDGNPMPVEQIDIPLDQGTEADELIHRGKDVVETSFDGDYRDGYLFLGMRATNE